MLGLFFFLFTRINVTKIGIVLFIVMIRVNVITAVNLSVFTPFIHHPELQSHPYPSLES